MVLFLEELPKREGEVIREIGTLNSNIASRNNKQYNIKNSYTLKKQKKAV
jgi:hypothetical protein